MLLVKDVPFPVGAAGLRVDAGNAVLITREDELGRAALGLEDARRGVTGAALARHLPAHLAGQSVERDEGALAVLFVRNDQEIVVHDRGSTEAVARLKRAEIGAPLFVAVVIEGQDEKLFRRAPAEIDVARI